MGVNIRQGKSLNAVSCSVERQYLEQLFIRYGGDLGRIADVLLGEPNSGRKVQNQLGVKLASLKRRLREESPAALPAPSLDNAD